MARQLGKCSELGASDGWKVMSSCNQSITSTIVRFDHQNKLAQFLASDSSYFDIVLMGVFLWRNLKCADTSPAL